MYLLLTMFHRYLYTLRDRPVVLVLTEFFSNVISTVNLECQVELRKLVLHVRSAEYNPKRFPGAVVRLREPRATCLVFSNGKLVCTGARSEAEANLASRKCARIIQKIGFQVTLIHSLISSFLWCFYAKIFDVRFTVVFQGSGALDIHSC